MLEPLLGGCLIGAGSLLAMAVSGKIPGVSGVVAKIIKPRKGDISWRIIFLIGLIIGAFLAFLIEPRYSSFSMPGGRSLTVIMVAAFLVGFGARLGGGCTSGHGVCGIGSAAKDALIYTCIFIATGMLTVYLWNQGGAS